LEYVGDAILDAVVADLMYCKFPDADEGRLTLMRSNLVNRKSLDKLSNVLGITDFIIAKTNESSHQHLAGNAFEALIGAIYYDRGYKYCRKFIDRIIIQNYNWEEIGLIEEDYKSIIFQFAQKMKWIVMFDTFEAIEANEKQFHFNAQLLLNNEFVAEGKGWSKKDAEQEASRRAYEKLSKTIALVK
jgi:ribonuclease-3